MIIERNIVKPGTLYEFRPPTEPYQIWMLIKTEYDERGIFGYYRFLYTFLTPRNKKVQWSGSMGNPSLDHFGFLREVK